VDMFVKKSLKIHKTAVADEGAYLVQVSKDCSFLFVLYIHCKLNIFEILQES